jgi:hypothetical protein
VIVDLSIEANAVANPGNPTRIANIKSLQVPSKGGAWLAYLKEEVKEPTKPAEASEAAKQSPPKADDSQNDESDQAQRRAAAAAAAGASATSSTPPRKETGTELVLRDLSTGVERRFQNVLEYSFSRDGKLLLYIVSSKAETDNGVYLVTVGNDAAPVTLIAGKGKYVKLTWDREQTQAAFMSDRDDVAAKQPTFKSYLWTRAEASAANEVALNLANGLPATMRVSDKGNLAFSRDGKKLLIPVAPPLPLPRTAENAPPEEERVVADIWRWNDDYVQPIQKVRAVQERNRTYRGAWDIATKRYVQLADETMRTVSLSDDAMRAVGLDDRAYRRLTDFDGGYVDFYVVNAETGARKLAIRKMRDSGNIAPTQWSPDGKWLLYYQGAQWHVLNTQDGSTRNLTKKTKVAFYNEEQDTPGPKAPYGTGGWLSDSSAVLLYDRYDVWQFFIDGRAAKNLTLASGRQAKTRLRLQPIEPVEPDDDERGINPMKPLVMRGENEDTRATGFFQPHSRQLQQRLQSQLQSQHA